MEIPREYYGWWRIIRTSQWVDEYLDDLGPAVISLTGYGDRLRMHMLLAYVNCRPTASGVSFSWQGAWEWDPMSGTGSVKLCKDGRLAGRLKIEGGDSSTFVAEGTDEPPEPIPDPPSHRSVSSWIATRPSSLQSPVHGGREMSPSGRGAGVSVTVVVAVDDGDGVSVGVADKVVVAVAVRVAISVAVVVGVGAIWRTSSAPPIQSKSSIYPMHPTPSAVATTLKKLEEVHLPSGESTDTAKGSRTGTRS